ncbi:hypothetical protein ACFQZ8_02365 [Micromonospora azadirachtae]|uniref:Papain fold toxin 1, glutamine deamidase n=1 Tax=Micromonospora azadirachtae TaxID=1970735 RepID=A0ABW2ZW23_9ACTN
MSAFAPANFGSKRTGSPKPPGADSLPPGIAERLRDCGQAHTRLLGLGEGKPVDVTAPWAGDKRTVGVMAAPGETTRTLADRILAGPEFGREGDPVDSITLLTSTGIGAELRLEFAARGFPVRVYEASSSLTIEPSFTITGGGHWVVHGDLTAMQELAVTYELIRADQTDFGYAAAPTRAPGSKVPIDDRAGSRALLDSALDVARSRSDGVLDLTVVARTLSRAERPALLWPALLRLLRGQLGQIRTVVDMYLDPQTGRWRTVDLPVEVRRLFTATGRHSLEGDTGRRDVDFNRGATLLSGAAIERPLDREALATWLAESAVDRTAQREPLPAADVAGLTADLQSEIIGRLRALKVDERTARAWADEMINGARDASLPMRTTPVQDESLEVPDTPTELESTVAVPIGGGVYRVLREVLIDDPAPLRAAYEVAAHYLRDRTGAEVSPGDAADVAAMSGPVSTLVEIIALSHLRLRGALDPKRVPPVDANRQMPVLVTAAGPHLRGFLATHETVIRQALADTLPPPAGDTPLWDTRIGETTTLGESLRELFDPENDVAGQWLPAVGGQVHAAEARRGDDPWHLPHINLRLAADRRWALDQVAAASHSAASLLAALDVIAEGVDPAEALTDVATRSAALGRLQDLLGSAVARYPHLELAARGVLRDAYRLDLPDWLAETLAALPHSDGRTVGSAQRLGDLLGGAGVIPPRRSAWTAPALAAALDGEWRDVSVEGLWALPVGSVTPLWGHGGSSDRERVVLMQRSLTGLTLVDTLAPVDARIRRVSDRLGVTALLAEPIRVMVDGDDRIIPVAPNRRGGGVVAGATSTSPSSHDGLAAPNFGGAARGAEQRVPRTAGRRPDLEPIVITVDGRAAGHDQTLDDLDDEAPGTSGQVALIEVVAQDPAAIGLGWLAEVNPWRGVGGDFLTNCVLAAIGTDMSLEAGGTFGHQVPPAGELDLTFLSAYANDPARKADQPAKPFRFVRATVGDVLRALDIGEVGDRGIVAVPGEPGHVLNAVRTAHGSMLLDGQLGKLVRLAESLPIYFLSLTSTLVVDGPAVPEPELGRQKAGAAGFEAETRARLDATSWEGRQFDDQPKIAKSPLIDVAIDLDGDAVILELVSEPYNLLDGEDEFADRRQVLAAFRAEHEALRGVAPGTNLSDFYARRGFKVDARAEAFHITASHRSHGNYMQHTVGLPLAGLYDFMAFAEENANAAHGVDLSRLAREFADDVVESYVGHRSTVAWERDLEAMSLRGFMASVFAHVLAAAYRDATDPTVLIKNSLLVASRVSLAAMRRALPDNVQRWLAGNVPWLREHFRDKALTHRKLAGHLTRTGFRDVLSFSHDGSDGSLITAGKFLNNALLPAGPGNEPLDHRRVLHIRTTFESMRTPKGGLPVAPQELRFFNKDLVGLADALDGIDRIDEEVKEIDRRIRNVPRSPDAAGRDQPYQIDFRSGRRDIDRQQLDRIAALAYQIVQNTDRALAAGVTTATQVTVEGGGNKSGSGASGERAENVATALRREVARQLSARHLDQNTVKIHAVDRATALSRLPDARDRPSTSEQRRSVKVWAEPLYPPTAAPSRAARFALGSSRFGHAAAGWPRTPLPTRHTAESLAESHPWLGAINPSRAAGGEAMTNCVVSALSFVLAEEEQAPIEAATTEALPGSYLVNFQRQRLGLDDEQHRAYLIPDMAAAAEALRHAGDGAKALVAVRSSIGNHVYVGFTDAAGVTFVDPQLGELAADPVHATGLVMLPLSPQIPAPPGSRLLTSDEVGPPEPANEETLAWQSDGARTAVPDSVGLMSRLFGRAGNDVPRERVAALVAEWRFPVGLRLEPTEDADWIGTPDWVAERLVDPTMSGVHSPPTWAAFRRLVDRAGEGGVALTLPEAGRDTAAYMRAGGEIWRIRLGPEGVEAERWTEPPALPIGVEEPPRRVLAFNKCADFLV